jgi:glycosidase
MMKSKKVSLLTIALMATVAAGCDNELPIEFKADGAFLIPTDGGVVVPDKSVPDLPPGVDRGPTPDKGVTPDGPVADGPVHDGPKPPPVFDWRDGVMYFVLLDRFRDGNSSNNNPVPNVTQSTNFQGGDLAGLLGKIKDGYFTDLGVNVLWLSSPVDAPDGKYPGRNGPNPDGHEYTGYHGYWPRDLTKVESRLGDMALLKEVINEAHKRNIKVLVDYVMNHVHDTSPTYTQNRSWFWSKDKPGGGNCLCGDGCSWETEPETLRCWFDPFLPDFDFTKQAPRDFSVENAIWWIKETGIDGFRLDAVKHIQMAWLTQLRSRVKGEIVKSGGSRFYMVGETFSGDKNVIKKFVDADTKLDGQFDFPLRVAMVKTILMRQGSFADLDNELKSSASFYGASSIMSNFIGNHDIPRPIHFAEDQPMWDNVWANGKERGWDNTPSAPNSDSAYERLQIGFTVLFTIPGIPLIYYGDEVGMPGAGDPDNRRFMQWDNYQPRQTKLRDHITKLAKLRAQHSCLRRGNRTTKKADNNVFVYEMSDAQCTLTIAINRTDSTQSVQLSNSSYTDLLNGGSVGQNVQIPARSSVILQ